MLSVATRASSLMEPNALCNGEATANLGNWYESSLYLYGGQLVAFF